VAGGGTNYKPAIEMIDAVASGVDSLELFNGTAISAWAPNPRGREAQSLEVRVEGHQLIAWNRVHDQVRPVLLGGVGHKLIRALLDKRVSDR